MANTKKTKRPIDAELDRQYWKMVERDYLADMDKEAAEVTGTNDIENDQ